jgi:hypothetical protein
VSRMFPPELNCWVYINDTRNPQITSRYEAKRRILEK